jgi:hypothetical protein
MKSWRMSQRVIRGKDEWLFLANDPNHLIERITYQLTFSQRRLVQWQYILETRFLWLREKGIPYFFVVTSNKKYVYPEYLPEDTEVKRLRCIEQFDRFYIN